LVDTEHMRKAAPRPQVPVMIPPTPPRGKRSRIARLSGSGPNVVEAEDRCARF
jgi:hypothetical protein